MPHSLNALPVKMSKKAGGCSWRRSSLPRVNFKETTFERNFITAGRAITEFLLKPSQLEGLPKTIRRSPYESGVSIVVYNRKDVETRSVTHSFETSHCHLYGATNLILSLFRVFSYVNETHPLIR